MRHGFAGLSLASIGAFLCQASCRQTFLVSGYLPVLTFHCTPIGGMMAPRGAGPLEKSSGPHIPA